MWGNSSARGHHAKKGHDLSVTWRCAEKEGEVFGIIGLLLGWGMLGLNKSQVRTREKIVPAGAEGGTCLH